ncbi:protein IRX15-LIKE-like [Miscanthus floridulus]|uniref:protein IRX15-LIKE-like n=1 Tax=Miscanthus floridulus TaxID=154761 RepID=UPI0034582877
MMKAMAGPKLLVVHTPSNKALNGMVPTSPASPMPFLGWSRCLWLVVFLALFTCVSLLTVFSTARASAGEAYQAAPFTVSGGAGAAEAGLPRYVFDALVHYAAAAGNSSSSMPEPDVLAIASVLRRRAPCNLLVFGLGAETPLWRALNHGGRTVFLDENPYYVAHLEGKHPGLEAYDVAYATAVRELPGLLDAARAARAAECRPVQNLLFSECRLAINDLPNQLYDVAWDVILVDGPRGFTEGSPGRMSAIYSAAVMARTKGTETEVMVHDYEREVERACGREFLCDENRVTATSTPSLGHFLLRGGAAVNREAFCGPPAAQKSKSN